MNKVGVKASHRVAASEMMADGFILGIDNCEENGTPLTQVQKIHMLSSMFLEFHSGVRTFEETIDTVEVLNASKRTKS